MVDSTQAIPLKTIVLAIDTTLSWEDGTKESRDWMLDVVCWMLKV